MTRVRFYRTFCGVSAAAMLLAGCGDEGAAGGGDDGINLPTEGEGDSDDGLGESSDGANADGPGGCGASTFMLDHEPTNVVLVLDKSFSMVDNVWDHDGDPATDLVTRWHSLHSSVSFIVGEFDAGLNFGAVLFPSVEVPDNEPETACHVRTDPDAVVAPSNGAAVLASLPGPDEVELYGGTPASGGINTALEHLRSLDAEVPRALIFVTDGAANCLEGSSDDAVFTQYDENLAGLVEAAREDGIPTFVVGIDILDEVAQFPQDNPFDRLNEVAVAGGFPRPGQERFHNAQDEDELRAAISQISSQIGCTVPLDPIPESPELLSIMIDGEEVTAVDSCDGAEEGWRYTNPDGPYDEIELCSSSCNALHDLGTLAAHYNCVPPA